MKILTVENDKPDVMKMACDLCLKRGLYVQGRMAKGWMQKPENMVKMCVAFQGKSAIGWAHLYLSKDEGFYEDNPILGCFVEPSWRNKQVGRNLVRELLKDTGDIYVDPRIQFFKNCGAVRKKQFEMENSF